MPVEEHTITLLSCPEPLEPGYIIRVSTGGDKSLLVKVVRVIDSSQVVVRYLTAWEQTMQLWQNAWAWVKHHPAWRRIRDWYRR